MNKLTENQSINETIAIASRRKFLQQLGYGSLLVVGGTSIANAAKHTAVKHAAHAVTTAHSAKPVAGKHHEIIKPHAAAVNHHAGKHEVLHHAAATKGKHEAVHHTAKHEAGKHSAGKHTVLAAHHEHEHVQHHAPQHHQAAVSHSVIDYSPEPLRPAPLHSSASAFAPHKMLTLKNAHTGDALKVTYFEHGRYIEDALKEIDNLYQDHLTGDIYPIDTALLDQLHEVKYLIGTDKPIHIVCGYRSPMTNAYLRRQSGAVARNSLHMQGRAVDIRIEGVDAREIRNAALAMAKGGVGYYPSANFVHLDTGELRTWQS